MESFGKGKSDICGSEGFGKGQGEGFRKGKSGGFGKGQAEGCGKGDEGFGKGTGKGGARHFPKPYIDSGLLYKVLADNVLVLKNLGSYEHVSKANCPCPKGLVHTIGLWKSVLKLEPSGEVHPQPLRTALISLLAERPELNCTSSSGQVWANLRMERISCILFHVRKLGRDGLTSAAAKLCRDDFSLLQQGLKLLEIPDALEKVPKPVALPLEKGRAAENSNRKLKKENSDVSMDSKGFPKMFEDSNAGTPKKTGTSSGAAMCIARRRPGQMVSLEKDGLQAALGYGKKPLKRPASALEKALKRPASALEKVEKARPKKDAGKTEKKNHAKTSSEKEKRKPWLKVKKTVAWKKPRSYLTGTTEKGGKLKLIVEVSGARCPDWHSQMVGEIWASLEKEALTKSEAIALREKLCKEWGANW